MSTGETWIVERLQHVEKIFVPYTVLDEDSDVARLHFRQVVDIIWRLWRSVLCVFGSRG